MSIMPGIEARAPERTETSSGLSASPKRLPVSVSDAASARPPRLQRRPDSALVGVEVRAGLGGDGEAGRHRQAERRHLGQVGALAAEQVLHRGVAVGAAAAKGVDPSSPRFWHRLSGGAGGAPRPKAVCRSRFCLGLRLLTNAELWRLGVDGRRWFSLSHFRLGAESLSGATWRRCFRGNSLLRVRWRLARRRLVS